MLFVQSEATAARRRFPIYLVDATDGLTPETGEAAGQPQISKAGGAFANTTATLTAVGNGSYYVELTATELNTLGNIVVRYKSANTAEFNMPADVVALNIHLATQAVNVTQWGGATPNALISGRVDAAIPEAQIDQIVNEVWDEPLFDHLVTNSTGEALVQIRASVPPSVTDISVAVWNTPVPGAYGAGSAGAILGNLDDAVAAVQADTDALQISVAAVATPAQVRTEVDGALDTAVAQPTTGAPPANPSLRNGVAWLMKAWRNRTTQTTSQYSLYDDAGTVVQQKASFSDDGTTADRSEVVSGP